MTYRPSWLQGIVWVVFGRPGSGSSQQRLPSGGMVEVFVIYISNPSMRDETTVNSTAILVFDRRQRFVSKTIISDSKVNSTDRNRKSYRFFSCDQFCRLKIYYTKMIFSYFKNLTFAHHLKMAQLIRVYMYSNTLRIVQFKKKWVLEKRLQLIPELYLTFINLINSIFFDCMQLTLQIGQMRYRIVIMKGKSIYNFKSGFFLYIQTK